MSVKPHDVAAISAIIRPLLGQPAWGAALGVGSFLTIEFGDIAPSAEGERKIHGEWHLWVCHCAWRIDTSDAVIAGSDDEPATMRDAIECLNGQVLRSVQLFPPGPDAKLLFGESVVLNLFPINSSGEYEYWMLFTPDGNVLTVGEDKGWSVEPA
jgi:hypothetical protein